MSEERATREHCDGKAFERQFTKYRNANARILGVPRDRSEAAQLEEVRSKHVRQADGDILEDLDDYLGPWAAFDNDLKIDLPPPPDANRGDDIFAETATTAEERVTTTFFGKSLTDYQGRSWIESPTSVQIPSDSLNNDAYLPKKHEHSYVAHTMGVNSIRWFPKSGHLLLSASLDGSCRVWDLHNDRKCLRSYTGHTQACRQANFTSDGTKFYSCGYDNKVILWDTETGKMITEMGNGFIPYCATVKPDDPDVVICGSSNNRAVQYDGRTGQIVQEYSEHLSSVNTVTFTNNNRKIMTSSDDKKVFIWEYGIPVVVKHIAEPFMHSCPAAALHPEGEYVCYQSMDNQIVTYEGQGRFRFQRKKRFRGHSNSGYAIEPSFSPNGRFLVSGDSSGKMFVWDWNKGKQIKALQCHDSVVMTCQWHPVEPSLVATASWDGIISLWR
eukprot:GHVH01015002.1.p1 GENE.GHVH01015002.1~~GHVH01015002.1.p1  ORF type:complete len:459 (+),score=52.46 GHVH01015002.1:50-1378(+)